MKKLGRYTEVYERVGMELIPEEVVITKHGSNPYQDEDGNISFTAELINAKAQFHTALINLLLAHKEFEEGNYVEPLLCSACDQREVEEYKDSGICDACDGFDC